MAITFYPSKRAWTLQKRGLDVVSVQAVFDGQVYTFEDQRTEYGEPHHCTAGLLVGRMAMVCWTPRGADRHVISSRKANARAQARFNPLLR